MLLVFALVLLVVDANPIPPGFPTPLQECSKHFTAPYSCKGNYTTSALFISPLSEKQNAPELLYNGACNSPLSFNLATAGFDTGFAVHLGSCQLGDLAFDSVQRPPRGSKIEYETIEEVKIGECYGVYTLHSDVQAMWAFKVESAVQNGPADISYTIFWYQRVERATYVYAPNYNEHPTAVCSPA